MEILLDSVLAFLSCIGLWTLGRMIFEGLYTEYRFFADDYFVEEEIS